MKGPPAHDGSLNPSRPYTGVDPGHRRCLQLEWTATLGGAFLDDVQTSDNVRRALARLEEVARKQGYAVAIGHPHAVTLTALEDWLAGAEARGFVLAPVSAIVRRRLSAPRAGARVQNQARR